MNKTKKWLALGFSLLSISLLVACGNSQKTSETAPKEVQTEKASTSEAKKENKSTYSIGDTITFDKHAEYTITNVEWTDERNEFDNSNPDKVLKVTYNVKNLSEEDMPIGVDIDLYVGGKKWKVMPMSIPWVQSHLVDQWKALLNILVLKAMEI